MNMANTIEEEIEAIEEEILEWEIRKQEAEDWIKSLRQLLRDLKHE
jgi:hypothetical protein